MVCVKIYFSLKGGYDTESRRLFGRRVIYTEAAEVTEANILDVLDKAYQQHAFNETEIDYLYRYYKGDQPILYRKKEIRSDIKNMVVENRANEIVSFKTGYHLGEPVQYVSRTDDEGITEEVLRLNDYMLSEDKPTKDKELDDWAHICGTSYRMVLPDKYADVEDDEAPFEIFTLDPRYTFVVYSDGLGHKPMLGVRYIRKEDDTMVFSCYTKDAYYEIESPDTHIRNAGRLTGAEGQIFGIPIIEYPANNARLGAFETVIPLLDAINNVESNRLDGIEQFVQAYWKFVGCKVEEETFNRFKKMGAIMVPPNDNGGNIDVDLITKDLDQDQTQTFVDSLYDAVLTIVGMPNRNGGSSTSDTGTAVIYRDGWSSAEARAKASDLMFRRSEKEFLKLALRICRDMAGLSLKLSALDIRFTRRNYENISEKANTFVALANSGKIALDDVYVISGLFPDPQASYRKYLEWREEQPNGNAELDTGNDSGGRTDTASAESGGDQG